MSKIRNAPLSETGTNNLVECYRVHFLLAARGDEEASRNLPHIVEELHSRDIGVTQSLTSRLSKFMWEAAREEQFDLAIFYRQMIAHYKEHILSNH